MLGGEHHADSARGKILDFAPVHCRDVKAVIGTVQGILGSRLAIVQNHVKAAACGDNQLTELAVRMAPARCSAWDVVQVIHALDIKREEFAAFDEQHKPTRWSYATRSSSPWPRRRLAPPIIRGF